MTSRRYASVSTAEAIQGFVAGALLVDALVLFGGCGEVEESVAAGAGILFGSVALCLTVAWVARVFFGPGCECGQLDDEPHSPGCSALGGGP